MAFKVSVNNKFLISIVIILVAIIMLLLAINTYTETTYSLEPNYIICLPQGGLIDMCNSILRCHKYAVEHNRVLIVDTTTGWFNDDINEYLQIHSPFIYTGHPNTIYHKIKDLSVYPRVDISSLKPKLVENESGIGHRYVVGDTSLTIDLSKGYHERIIVYSMYRVGPSLFNELLLFSSFSKLVLDAYWSARARLPNYYIGVHVRNTDYKSDVPAFLSQNEMVFKDKPLFLASDDKDTIELFKKKYGSSIHTFTDLPANKGKPLHYIEAGRSLEDSRKYNIDTFVDFLLLATANEYYYSSSESGFSLAVRGLRGNDLLLKRLVK